MPGLGKTALARKLYRSSRMASYFHVHSWCCVSQIYTKRGLLLDILNDVIEVDDGKTQRMSDDDLTEMLCRSLKVWRYLIALDDIRDVDAWSDIRCCFPDQANGSRILLTSHSELVSLEIKPNGAPVNLRMFSKEESWELLQKNVFGGRSCPSELSNIEDYPFLLRKHSFEEDKRIMGILELSYQYLPDHLIPCFLHFGIFLKTEISVQKLVSPWIAEGLVQKMKGKNVEDVGEGYVKKLVGRNMVMIAKRRKSKEGIKACNTHDLLLQFCFWGRLKKKVSCYFRVEMKLLSLLRMDHTLSLIICQGRSHRDYAFMYVRQTCVTGGLIITLMLDLGWNSISLCKWRPLIPSEWHKTS